MNKISFKKVVKGGFLSMALLIGVSANASDKLTPQDALVTTIVDKSVISGSLAKDAEGKLVYDAVGNARFQYTGKIYSLKTDINSGELSKLGKEIGSITGEAAFPKEFVALSAAVNEMMSGNWTDPMPKFPPVVPWTCNHCEMIVNGSKYISIVDALSPTLPDGVTENPYYNIGGIADNFDGGIDGGAAAAFATMGMDGRAFTGVTPASFDPATKTMSVRMAGCSAVIAIEGPHAGKMGTLCMNSTATFDVSGAYGVFDSDHHMVGYEPNSNISASGSSNCVTVLHNPLSLQ
ncbi:hypothetical protein [Kaarinaea lacus]